MLVSQGMKGPSPVSLIQACTASRQHHLLHHSQRGFRFQGICCDRKSRFMLVFKKWVCRSSEASERSLSSKQAELSLAQQALAALQDTSALQSR